MQTGIVDYSSSDEEGHNLNKGTVNQNKLESVSPRSYSSTSAKSSDLALAETHHHHKYFDRNKLKRKTEDDKRCNVLPLPDSIQCMYKKSKICDEPNKHGGKIRSFEHTEGNWATYCYVPFTKDDQMDLLTEDLIKMLKPLKFEPMNDFHVSLSRTVAIRHHWIDPLTQSIQSKLQNFERFFCGIKQCKFYSNDENTRTFLSLEACDSRSQLKHLTELIDESFEEFNLEKYYQNPSYHISIAWCLNNVTDQITDKQKLAIEDRVQKYLDENQDYIDINKVTCKSGNKIFDYHLKSVCEN